MQTLMAALSLGQLIAHQAATCGTVPKPTPTVTGLPGGDALMTMLNWAWWLGLGACLLGVAGSGVAMAVGHFGENYRAGEAGKKGLVWAVVGALVIGLGPSLVNALFALGDKAC